MVVAAHRKTGTSAAEELDHLMDEIIDGKPAQIVAAARALGVKGFNPKGMQPGKVRGKFEDELALVREALEAKPPFSRQDLASLAHANAILDELSLIKKGPGKVARAMLNSLEVNPKGTRISFTTPNRGDVQDWGELLNKTARQLGLKFPVFNENGRWFWREGVRTNSADTASGETHTFTLKLDAGGFLFDEQRQRFGDGAPLGAIAIAEGLLRIRSGGKRSLFNPKGNTWIAIRGASSDVELKLDPKKGVTVVADSGHRDSSSIYAVKK